VNRVGIMGGGPFGRAFARLLLDAGHEVSVYDPHREPPAGLGVPTSRALVQASDVVVLAVPVAQMESALQEIEPVLQPSQWVMDVGSVKLGPEADMRTALGTRIPWVATHPLFGPSSLARGERPLRVVICPSSQHPDAVESARDLYEKVGCEVLEADADSHDRIMARTHALAFFVAKGMIEIEAGDPVPFSPPSFQAMARTIDTVRSDAGHLFYAIQHENTHAAAERQGLIEALQRIDEELCRAEATTTDDDGSRLAIPDLGIQTPDLGDLIAEVDRGLVELLARRARLSSRAPQPPVDENDLLAERERWAASTDVDSRIVRAVFEAILRGHA
jgi:prephenate dehydrogenase